MSSSGIGNPIKYVWLYLAVMSILDLISDDEYALILDSIRVETFMMVYESSL